MVCFYLVRSVKNEEILFAFNCIGKQKKKESKHKIYENKSLRPIWKKLWWCMLYYTLCMCMFRQAIKVNLN